jgi:hypothetical protein
MFNFSYNNLQQYAQVFLVPSNMEICLNHNDTKAWKT